jgi:hypothetical protein
MLLGSGIVGLAGFALRKFKVKLPTPTLWYNSRSIKCSGFSLSRLSLGPALPIAIVAPKYRLRRVTAVS